MAILLFKFQEEYGILDEKALIIGNETAKKYLNVKDAIEIVEAT